MIVELKCKATAKNKKAAKRLSQVVAWAQSRFAAPFKYEVALRDDLDKDEAVGRCELDHEEGKLYVDIQAGAPLEWQIDTLLHEWAHVITFPFMSYQRSAHCDEFWISFGRIYRAFYEDGGMEASKGIKVVK